MSTLRAHGLAVDLTPGWDARIRREPAPAPPADKPVRGFGPVRAGTDNPVVHVATFALPEQRGDFGGGAVELMRPSDVFVCLLEYDQEAASTPLFAPAGLPRTLRAQDFEPHTMQRTIGGQAGLQRFFHERGRAFCLYVVLGSYALRRSLVERVNSIVSRITIE